MADEPGLDSATAVAEAPQDQPAVADSYDFSKAEDALIPSAEAMSRAIEAEKAPDQQPTEAETEGEDGFGADLLARAAEYGINESESRAHGTPDALERTLRIMDRRFASMGREGTEPRQQTPAPQRPVEDDSWQFKAPLPKPEHPEDGDEFDPALSKHLKAMTDHYNGQLGVVREAIRHLSGYMGQAEERATERAYTAWVESLDEGTQQVMLDDDLIDKVYEQAKVLARVYAQSGMPVPHLEECSRRALYMLAGEKMTTKAKQGVHEEIAEKSRKRAGQAISRPTQRKPAAGSDERDVLAAIRDEGKRLGLFS